MTSARVLIAQVSHESNTFSSAITPLEAFESCGLFAGPEVPERFEGTDTELGGFLDGLHENHILPVGGVAASAIPSGPVSNKVVQDLIGRVVERCRVESPDGVLLALHGAMVDEDFRSAEVALLTELRRHLPTAPIVCTLDLHTNLGEELVRLTDGLIPYDTNPHVDMYERGCEAAGYIANLLRRRIRPTSHRCAVPILLSPLCQGTSQPAMRELMSIVHRWESSAGILNVGVFAGMAFADVADTGFSVVAYADGSEDLAALAARDVARTAWALRHEFQKDISVSSVEESIGLAQQNRDGVLLLAEVADNINAGTLGEATHLLRRLIDEPALSDTVYGSLADPAAVAKSIAAGVGSTVDLELGAKTVPINGTPVRVRAQVRVISDGRFLNRYANNGAGMLKGLEVRMGRTVVLDSRDTPARMTIVVSERPVPAIGPEMFESLGISVRSRKVLVVKTRGHYWRDYPFVAEIAEVSTPGMATPDVATLQFVRSSRNLFPLSDPDFVPC